MNVLVTGGTGTLGHHVVMLLRQSGHRARILSRRPRGHVDAVQGDLRSGAGLSKALAGMDVVVHAASATHDPLLLWSVDVRGTRRLLAMAREAKIRHFIFMSIVGIDGVSYPYYRIKLAAEAAVSKDVVPWSILRATQFHEFVDGILRGFSRAPRLLAAPLSWQLQPVEVREVARRVADLAIAEPGGMLPDFAGPEIRELRSLAQSWLDARKDRRRIVNLPLPFKLGRQIAEGRLTSPEHKEGKMTFEQYLSERYG